MEDLTFRIHGLDCAEEVAVLKKALKPLGLSGDSLSFDLLAGMLRVRASEAPDDQAIVKAVSASGMRAERLTPADGPELPGG